jgi:hypothetical protein
MADTQLLSVGKPGVTASVSGTTFDSRGDYFEWLIANGVDREAANSGLPDTPLSRQGQQVFAAVPPLYNTYMRQAGRRGL